MMKDKKKPEQNWTRFIGKEVKVAVSFGIAAAVVCIAIILFAMFSAPGGPATIYRPCGRIVVTSDSKSPNGTVSATFERCRYFIIYDLASKKFKSVINPYFNEMDSGVKSARFIMDRAEEAVITGNIGPLAFQMMENFNMQVYLVHKTTVRDAVKLFLEGGLVNIQSQNLTASRNIPVQSFQQPMQAQAVAWQTGFAGIPQTRTAYCPLCRFIMPLGAHIRTNRIMCPYCPGQSMQIMAPGNQALPPNAGQPQQVGFGQGNRPAAGNPVSRGIIIMR